MSIQAMKGVGIGDGVRRSRAAVGLARRTTRSSGPRSAATTARPTAPGGLEGGMTTGDPLVVRGAMKPLPTLTKPLRSVDIETKEPAAGAARAHRLVHRARRRRGGGGDGRARARRRPTARSSAATTWTTRCAALRAYRGAHRVEALAAAGRPAARGATAGALVFVGFMGAGKSSAARAVAAALGRRAARLRPRARARARRADRGVLRPRGRGRVPRARGGGRARAARRARDARVVALGGGALGSERGARGAAPAHGRATSRSSPDDAWRRASGKGRPLARDRGALRRAPREQRRAVYEAVADAIAARRRPRRCRARALPRCSALRDAPAGHAARVGRGRVGRLPGLLRPRAGRRAASSTRTRPPLRGDRRERGAPPLACGRRATRRSPPGEAAKTLRERRGRAAPDGARRASARDDLVVARRRRRGGRPRRASARAVYQRGMRARAGAHDAGRAGRLRVRRQDRRRPARGRRTTWAPTTSRRRCSSTRRRSRRCRRRRAAPPATRRWSRPR